MSFQTKPQRVAVDYFDAQELAAYMLGLNPEKPDSEAIYDGMCDQFNIDLDDFSKLLSYLLPLIEVEKSPITKTHYKGFRYFDKYGLSTWAVKMEISTK